MAPILSFLISSGSIKKKPTCVCLSEAKASHSHKMWTEVSFSVDCVWNVMAHAQKPDFVFRRNGRVHSNRQGRHIIRLLAAEVCASAVVMLDTPCSEVKWRVLATHSIRQFPLHFPSRASPCAITFQLDSYHISYKFTTWNFNCHTLSAKFGLSLSEYSNLILKLKLKLKTWCWVEYLDLWARQ